jgi:predicted nucleic acid-binding protein
LASGTRIIVTGDRALLKLDGFRVLAIMTPRRFADKHLA